MVARTTWKIRIHHHKIACLASATIEVLRVNLMNLQLLKDKKLLRKGKDQSLCIWVMTVISTKLKSRETTNLLTWILTTTIQAVHSTLSQSFQYLKNWNKILEMEESSARDKISSSKGWQMRKGLEKSLSLIANQMTFFLEWRQKFWVNMIWKIISHQETGLRFRWETIRTIKSSAKYLMNCSTSSLVLEYLRAMQNLPILSFQWFRMDLATQQQIKDCQIDSRFKSKRL